MNSYVVNLYPIPTEGAAGETLDVNNTVTSTFTTANLNYKTSCCYVTITGGDCHVTFDGSTPSSTNGNHLIVPYDRIWSKDAVRLAKFKATSGTISHVTMSQFTY